MNGIDKDMVMGLKWFFAAVVILLMGYGLTADGSEIESIEYQDNNVSGCYYHMSYDCELFDPKTGEILSDDNISKCKVFMYKDGHALHKATQEELDRCNRGYKERMY